MSASRSFDWNHARAFLATAEEGSLSAAARALGTTQPTMGRQIAALERELGVVLFERVGRGLVLTPSGERLLAHVRGMGAAASGLALAASGASEAVEGQVAVTASDLLCVALLPPVVAELRRRAPGIRLELVASNSLRDLLRREADIAVRHVETQAGELIARRLRDREAWLYAAPAYLERCGPLEQPTDLQRLDLVGFSASAEETAARLGGGYGIELSPDQVRSTSENGVAIRELVAAGLGVTPLPEHLGDRDPRLVRVPLDLPPLVFPTWLVAHRELHRSARIRVVFDLLLEFLDA